ncbi:hypothetical protein AAIH16_38345, partial [Pseudomonas aeruginosa]
MTISYDKAELEEKIIRLFSDFFLAGISSDTPMPEVRERLQAIGTMAGRTVGVCFHEGEIGSEILMKIRACEND